MKTKIIARWRDRWISHSLMAVVAICLALALGSAGALADEPAKSTGEPAKSTGEPAKSTDEPAKSTDEPAKSTDKPAKSADQIAKELANPAGSLASLNFNFQYQTFKGDLPDADDQDSWSAIFQPVLPFPVGDKGRRVIFRPAVPFLFDQPLFDAQKSTFDNADFALGDIAFDLVYAGNVMKTKKTGYLWGVGAAGTLPSATDSDVAGGQWRLGPEFFGGFIREWGIVGALVSNQWNVAGWNDKSFSLLTAQYFYAYGLGNGWQIMANPVITYDWMADSDQALTLPVGVGLAKTTHIGGKPWKFQFQVQYFVEQPDAFGPEWLLKLTIVPVVENKLASLFK